MGTQDQPLHTFTINGKEAVSHDPTPTAAQLLSDAGFEPADDYVLVQSTEHGTRVVNFDDVLDLTGEHRIFFTSAVGEAFRLTVNEHDIYWPGPDIEIGRIRELAHVPEDQDLIWMRDETENEILPLAGVFPLSGRGVEHLRTHLRPVKPDYIYFVDGTEYHTDQDELTGAQIIMQIPNWNPQNTLVLEGEGGEPDEIVRANTVVVFKGRKTPAHFTTVPPATFGGV
jgi:hypothetical protein